MSSVSNISSRVSYPLKQQYASISTDKKISDTPVFEAVGQTTNEAKKTGKQGNIAVENASNTQNEQAAASNEASNEALQMIKQEISALSSSNISGVKMREIPDVINNMLSGIENCKSQLDAQKGVINDSEFSSLSEQLKNAQNATSNNILSLIDKLEEDPEMLSSVRNQILEKVGNTKSGETNVAAKVKDALEQKYPENKINELKEKKAIAVQIDNIKNLGGFLAPTSIKGRSKEDLLKELQEAQQDSSSNATTESTQQTLASNPISSGGFGSLTAQNKLKNGFASMLG